MEQRTGKLAEIKDDGTQVITFEEGDDVELGPGRAVAGIDKGDRITVTRRSLRGGWIAEGRPVIDPQKEPAAAEGGKKKGGRKKK